MKSSARACAIPERYIYPSALMTALAVSAVLPLTSSGIKTLVRDGSRCNENDCTYQQRCPCSISCVVYVCVWCCKWPWCFCNASPGLAKRNQNPTAQPKKKTKQQQTNPSPALLTERKNLLAVSEVWDVPGSDEQDSGVVAEV